MHHTIGSPLYNIIESDFNLKVFMSEVTMQYAMATPCIDDSGIIRLVSTLHLISTVPCPYLVKQFARFLKMASFIDSM